MTKRLTFFKFCGTLALDRSLLEQVVSYDTKPIADYTALQNAYDYYNQALFDNVLPDCLITLQRKRNTHGYFWSAIFSSRDTHTQLDELALNPESMTRSDSEILSTLVHEMCHVWQAHFGKPSRNGYHNKQWAEKMLAVGLMPQSVPGNKQTGQRCTHSIIPDALFDKCTIDLLAINFTLRYASGIKNPLANKAKNKIKYTCLNCNQNAWAKPDANLICGDCKETMI